MGEAGVGGRGRQDLCGPSSRDEDSSAALGASSGELVGSAGRSSGEGEGGRAIVGLGRGGGGEGAGVRFKGELAAAEEVVATSVRGRSRSVRRWLLGRTAYIEAQKVFPVKPADDLTSLLLRSGGEGELGQKGGRGAEDGGKGVRTAEISSLSRGETAAQLPRKEQSLAIHLGILIPSYVCPHTTLLSVSAVTCFASGTWIRHAISGCLVSVTTCFFVCAGTSIRVTRMLHSGSSAAEVERGPASPAGWERK